MKGMLVVSMATILLSGCMASGHPVFTKEIHNNQKVELTAEVHLASKDKIVKAPTVILLHGCFGPEYPHFQKWIDALNSWGYNAVVINSFTPRGARQVCDRPAMVVTKEQRSVDAYDTAKWVVKQDWANEKVGIVGFSHGGGTVLYSAASSYVERNFGKQLISAGVAYYPNCDMNFNWDKPAIPVQIHMGEADDWTPPGMCRDMTKNWGIQDQYFEYSKGTHGFDVWGMHQFSAPDATGKRHWIDYDANATELSLQRTKAFLDKYLK